MEKPRFLIAGDSAVTIEFGKEISKEVNTRIRSLVGLMKKHPKKGIQEVVPAFCSLMVYYDPAVLLYSEVEVYLQELLEQAGKGKRSKARVIEIPVCYGGKFGEDLEDVAAYAKLTKKEVIAIHSGTDYLIYMLGFLPGFAYLGGLDERLEIPRLENPRVKIAAGSVGIGGNQTGIYPLDSPGGWRLIGQTPLQPYDPKREKPILYDAGDYIRFIPVSEAKYRTIAEQVKSGTYRPVVREREE